MSAIALLTSCEAELETLPHGTLSITATWDGDHPKYEVTLGEGLSDISEVSIYETFTDTHFGNEHGGHRKIPLKPEGPYTYSGKRWKSYGKDKFEVYAKVESSIGAYRSESVSIVHPSEGIKITKAKYDGNYWLILYGKDFDMNAKYKIDGMDISLDKYSSTPDQLLFYGFSLDKSGLYEMQLQINDETYPITVDFPIARVAYISKKEIVVGDTITVQLKDCQTYTQYKFKNCETIKEDKEKQIYHIMPLSDKSGELDITPYDSYNGMVSYETVKINVKANNWTKALTISDKVSHIADNKIYSLTNNVVRIYDFTTGKELKKYNWNYSYHDPSVTDTYVLNDDIYIPYYLWASDDNSYIEKINSKTGNTELFCEIPMNIKRILYDGTNFLAFGNWEDYMYVINPKDGTYSKRRIPNIDCNIIHMEGEDVYSYADGYLVHFKLGDSQEEKLYCNYSIYRDNVLGIDNGWLFYALNYDKYILVYKAKMSTLNSSSPEIVNLGSFKTSFEWYHKLRFVNDGKNYYVIPYTNNSYEPNKTEIYKTAVK